MTEKGEPQPCSGGEASGEMTEKGER